MPSIKKSRAARCLSRSETARLVGSHPETIRYYEKIGLIPSPARSQAGYREYDVSDVSRLSFIVRLRALGFPVGDIRQLIEGSQNESLTCGTVSGVANEHLKSVQQKIAELRKLEKALVRLLTDCSGQDTAGCQFVDRLISEDIADVVDQ